MNQQNLYQQIKNILDANFVFADEVARVIALAIYGQKNVIIFGPGGHAKSAMIDEIVRGLNLIEDCFVQFFGEGMDESRLFGGLDFRKLEEEKILEYFPERSFLNRKIAVFEELFDAPASVLLALKDTLTAKEMRNGSQRFPMLTETIIVLTNHEPHEISELGPAAHALVERFPLRLDLRWDDYSAANYLAMFEKVSHRNQGPVMNGFKAILAEILAKANEGGNFVSPRTAVHALEVCQTAAALKGASEVNEEDLIDLKFVPGLEGLAETIREDLRTAMERAEAEKNLRQIEARFDDLECQLDNATRSTEALKTCKRLQTLENKLSDFRCPDSLVNRRNNLRNVISTGISGAQAKALEMTDI